MRAIYSRIIGQFVCNTISDRFLSTQIFNNPSPLHKTSNFKALITFSLLLLLFNILSLIAKLDLKKEFVAAAQSKCGIFTFINQTA